MSSRYGPGELYGLDVCALTAERLRELARTSNRDMECPFRASMAGKPNTKCSKERGVCSLRKFVQDGDGGVTPEGDPVTTCPNRFQESGMIVSWVGETLLETSTPAVISELPFLMGAADRDTLTKEAVGKIDQVLVNQEGPFLRWCALEMQADYFSGGSTSNDFRVLREWRGPGMPFPTVLRRPDFRSSGRKRLMPQLQIKVPTISRWGRKMAVVVDRAFWRSLGEMREVSDVSNCDIAWFVVSFSASENGRFSLQREDVYYTTLAHAVEGLTGGTPVSLDRFENEIRVRMQRL